MDRGYSLPCWKAYTALADIQIFVKPLVTLRIVSGSFVSFYKQIALQTKLDAQTDDASHQTGFVASITAPLAPMELVLLIAVSSLSFSGFMPVNTYPIYTLCILVHMSKIEIALSVKILIRQAKRF